MRKRLPYLIGFALILGIEIYIGAFVNDNFIRPYVGDILVTILLCCLGRCIFPEKPLWVPVAVLFFSAAVEYAQLIDIPELDGTVLGIILGSTFDVWDMACYALGCIVFTVAESFIKMRNKH